MPLFIFPLLSHFPAKKVEFFLDKVSQKSFQKKVFFSTLELNFYFPDNPSIVFLRILQINFVFWGLATTVAGLQ